MNKPFNAWKSVTIGLVVVIGMLFIFGYIFHKNEIKISEELRNDAEKITIDLNKQLNTKNEQIKIGITNYEKLKKQFEGIKVVDDLLKRDIELYILTTHPRVPNVVAKEISLNVVQLSKKYKVSPELILGIIKVESSFNPMAVGPKTKYGHARGLMQIMPEWVKKLELENQYDFHDIDVGIESGIKVFLIHLEEAKGDVSKGLYYYVNKDKKYSGKVYEAIGKFVTFRSTIDEDDQNVSSDIETNGDSKELDDKTKGKS